jgi:hypothetical protein
MGLLEKNGYITAGSGLYGIQETGLMPVSDPRFSDGRVWGGLHSNWVWETGVGASVASGVVVDGTFYPTSSTTGTYAHHIDYPNGKVVFDNAISTSATVACNYDYKYINVTRTDGLNWFKQLQQQVSQSDFPNSSGTFSFLPQNNYQVPAIGIEMGNNRGFQGYQLGGGQWIRTSFYAHCVAEDVYVRDFLVDAVSMQRELSFKMYDLNSIYSSGDFPLTVSGVPISGAKTFPNLVAAHPGRIVRLQEAAVDSIYSLSSRLHVGTVKFTTEIIHFGV